MTVGDFFRRLLRPARTSSEVSSIPSQPAAQDFVMPPADWSDEHAWDVFHGEEQPHHHFQLGLQYIPDFRAKRLNRVWFPGSGTSLAPRVFAELGFDVLSTDFSPVSVAVQERFARTPLSNEIAKFLEEHPAETAAKTMRVLRHDFRTALDSDPFEAILNMRAFQGLSGDDMRAAAKTHFTALEPGGWAIFDTSNVQGVHRDELEDTLAASGFAIPFRETERWYRSALRSTGIDFVMILGRPLVRGPKTSKKDQARLDGLSMAYRNHAEAEAEATRAMLEAPDTKIAYVVYSTG